MNFYNPYFMPYTTTRTGLFSSLFGGIKLSNILSGAQKTLNFVNQAIPVVKEISPMIKNTKTMFKVMNEFKKADTFKVSTNSENINASIKNYTEGPNFFI